MLSARLQDAFNEHIRAELFSANLYLAMSAHCEATGFKGFGRWLRAQWKEELAHAAKLVDYVVTRGGRVKVGSVEAAPADFGSMLKVFEATLAHERGISAATARLHAVAASEGDLAAQVYLYWFINEQVEEEASVSEIVEKLNIVGDKSSAVLYLDKEYGKRGAS